MNRTLATTRARRLRMMQEADSPIGTTTAQRKPAEQGGTRRSVLALSIGLALVLVYTLAIISSRHDTPHQPHDGMREKGILSAQNSHHDRTLRMVSFNIAELQPSGSSPEDWTEEQSEAVLREIVLRESPHVIMLQECPSDTWAKSFLSDYSSPSDAVRSHAGYVALLVHKDLVAKPFPLQWDFPGVAVHLMGGNLVVASVHLEPFGEGSYMRKEQMSELLQSTVTTKDQQQQQQQVLLVAGDTNMRDTEDSDIENLGFLDVWKTAGQDEATRYSWDTVQHDGWQNLYYGDSTRAYQRRYDRIYVAGLQHLEVPLFKLIGNTPIKPSTHHFLSDHFGIAAELQFT